jgi:hypothetical protein
VSRRLPDRVVDAFFAARPPRRHPATIGGGRAPGWPPDQPKPEPGDEVTVNWWVQPTLRHREPRRQPAGTISGTVLWVQWDLIGLAEAEGGWVCASFSWAGRDQAGVGWWHVPEVTVWRRRR